MAFRKIKYTLWLTALLISFLGLSGCTGREVVLSFPMQNGNSWNYQGTVAYTIGGQEQSMSPAFQLVTKQLGKKYQLFELALSEEHEELGKLQLIESPKGLIDPLTAEIWLPKQIKLGSKWNVTFGSHKLQFILRSEASTTVPAGTFPTYLIDFHEFRKSRGSLWLDPEVGIILFNWSYKTPGGHTATHLELTSYNLPGNGE